MSQEQIKTQFENRERWFKDRVGKRVFRTAAPCKCDTCENVYVNGLIIFDEFHAIYLNDCESGLEVKYFDTKEEVLKREKENENKDKNN